MRYKTQHYAEALYKVLKDKPASEQKKVLERFLRILDKNKDRAKLNLILKNVEKEYLKGNNLCKIAIESPDKISDHTKSLIQEIIGKAIFTEKLNKDLGAGIKLVINDHILIDATAQNYLKKIFK